MSIRTDLAIEAREMFAEEISGVESKTQDTDGITVTHVRITTEDGAKKIGKPIGNYITVEIKDLQYENEELCKRGAEALANELEKIIKISKDAPVLIAGLGNQYITPDSIGPKTIAKLTVTRHITKEGGEGLDFNVRAVSALAPGVLGLTGIETGEILRAVCDKIKPSLIIAVDALASRKLSRLGTTIQLCDSGISPGSGVGNNRKALTEETLGVPVIAIGVPMVVDAATLTSDTVEAIGKYLEDKLGEKSLAVFSDCTLLAQNALYENNTNMVVTPNDVDVLAQQSSDIIAEGINKALFL